MEQIIVEAVQAQEEVANAAVQELTLTELALVGGGSVIMCMD